MKEQWNKMIQLAHIKMSEQEKKTIFPQIQNIIKYFHHISKLSTDKVEPLISPMEEPLVFREDSAYSKENPNELTKQAPSLEGQYIKVPSVVNNDPS